VIKGVPTAINSQSDHSIDGGFLHVVFALILTGCLLIQVFIWHIYGIWQGKTTYTHFRASTDMLTGNPRGNWESQVHPCTVG